MTPLPADERPKTTREYMSEFSAELKAIRHSLTGDGIASKGLVQQFVEHQKEDDSVHAEVKKLISDRAFVRGALFVIPIASGVVAWLVTVLTK